MKMSKMYMPTLREVPAEAEIPSHKLLLRAGMTRRLVTGIYSYLPLGWRVIKKVEDVVREEMDNFGGQELLLSAVQPKEIWDATGRWEDFGPEMFRFKDRHDRQFCLGPTHEEYLTEMIKGEITSYKQMPLILYQIQTKYRDERRPRFGFMRAREFIMKDAYTFDVNEEAMKEAYMNQWRAYDAIFTRLGLDYKVVAGDSGAMGGDNSHEFMAMSEYGESLVAFCNGCNDYAATDEKAEVVYEAKYSGEEEKDLEKIHTPAMKTIEEVAEFLDQPLDRLAKALVHEIGEEIVVSIIPGDRELSETKLINHLGATEHEIVMASDETIEKIGSAPGFTGPKGLAEDVKILVDSRIAKMKNLVIGGNEADYHLINANFARDFKGEIVEDLLEIQEGDKCPKCGHTLDMARGIEVGNIFQLGTKYSSGLKASFLDQNGKEQLFYMGSYGIGVSRTVSAIIEQNYDEYGIIWPLNVAPYEIIITVINHKKEEQMELAENLYEDFRSKGMEVLLDDRDERAGVKFNDRDLIGIPIRITVGRGAKDGEVEYSLRKDGERQDVKVEDLEELILKEYREAGLDYKLRF